MNSIWRTKWRVVQWQNIARLPSTTRVDSWNAYKRHLTSFFSSSHSPYVNMDPSNIYQQIYDADISSAGGIPAIFTSEPKPTESGYVTVSEATDTSRVDDVLRDLRIPPSKIRSYELAEALFDNYDLDSSIADEITRQESAEEDELLEYVVDTAPMKVARSFIEQGRGRPMSDASWYASVKEAWFRPFRSGSSPTRSGFEHVFLGEAKGSKVGGLHWWYFYFNKMKDIDYLGAVYSNTEQGISVPEIVTMRFEWSAGNRRLFKKVGGFFVGVSVEGLMAMGMVRLTDSVHDAPRTVELQGALVKMTMFTSQDGRSVNTFYPEFRGVVSTIRPPPPPRPTPTPTTSTPEITNGAASNATQAFRLVAALANPEGDDTGRETVTILNISQQRALLEGWNVIGPNGSKMSFGNVFLNGGQARTFTVIRRGGLQLSNKGGRVQLVDQRGNVVQDLTYDRASARVQGGILVWNGGSKLQLQ